MDIRFSSVGEEQTFTEHIHAQRHEVIEREKERSFVVVHRSNRLRSALQVWIDVNDLRRILVR